MNRLRITEEQFNELYPDLEGHYNFFNDNPPAGISEKYMEDVYFKSKLWRMNNLYTIIGKDGTPQTFRMNYAQHKVYATSRIHPRVIILKSRQQGISTFWLVSFFDDAVWCPHLNLGLMAQGTDEASTLLERAKFLWDMLDPNVKAFLGVTLEKDNTKEFAFSNNSTIFIRVSFRSATLQRLHISEFGKIANSYPKRAKETKTGTLQALGKGQTGVIESTAEGRNMFKKMWDDSVVALSSGELTTKDFYPVFLSWLDDPDCLLDTHQTSHQVAETYFEELEKKTGRKLKQAQKNFWIAQYRELGGDIYQEYPGTPEEAFTASRDGTYYSKLFTLNVVSNNRIIKGLYDPNLPTDVYFDLGVDDYFVAIAVQWYRGEVRIVREYWNNGFGLEHYIDEVESWNMSIRCYKMPHDISVRELTTKGAGGLAKTRLEVMEEYFDEKDIKAYIETLPRESVADGIEAVRSMIPNMLVDASCEYIIDCMYNYSKEWDEKLQVWKKTPVHDEYSHGADAIRQVACNILEFEGAHKKRQSNSGRRRNRGTAL